MAGTHQYSNLVEVLERSVQQHGDRNLFGVKAGGDWRWHTYQEFGAWVDQFRGGLASLGVGSGDRVAVISNNRIEWAVGAYATYGLRALYVPMYEAQLPKEWKYILEDCGAKILLVANQSIAEKVKDFPKEIASLERVVAFDGSPQDPTSYAGLLAAGKAKPRASQQPAPGDTAGLIYTSGTTGKPKGVVLSHGNIASNINAIHALFPLQTDDVSLSFLPWAHSFGQTVELHGMLSMGASMGICEAVEKLIDNLAEVRPTVLFAVPRIFNRIYDGLNKKIEADSPFRKKLFRAALANSELRRELESRGQSSGWADFKHGLFDRLVFSKVKARFGGRLKYAISGGAALSTEVAKFIDNVGIMVFEGYGLTETSPIATANSPGARRIGSVGKAVPGVEVRIDLGANEENDGRVGEVQVHGPNVMQGYYNLPDETAKVMTEDGWFRTGDLGYKEADGFVYITGRIKEQYKLENGKYVAPAPLEEQLKLSGFIASAMVYGANRPYNVALLVPDFDALRGWAKAQGIDKSGRALLDDERVLTLFRAEIDKTLSDSKGFEGVRKFRLIEEDFTTANDMLTPKMSLKRRNVIKAYEGELNQLYS
ncbi:MAG: long-chain fatty acid--CoA ligase [Planctomycetaceae bacterium]|nr:long-chain fatty acid--CoA ligase [Myxococcota bacterium]NUN51884.1 long-chain fatty acid--CoA ligase [Planctomycetaceae bacterium]